MSLVALLDHFNNKIDRFMKKNPFQHFLLVLKLLNNTISLSEMQLKLNM